MGVDGCAELLPVHVRQVQVVLDGPEFAGETPEWGSAALGEVDREDGMFRPGNRLRARSEHVEDGRLIMSGSNHLEAQADPAGRPCA
ncbi:MAG: hypothetical protein U0Q19_17965 [Kineosporiaceae bacterium]